jgi:hypothetical protein
MRALMEDEEEADEEFWNQDALAEVNPTTLPED